MSFERFQLGSISIGYVEATDERYSESFFESFLFPEEIQLSKKFKHPTRKLEFLAGRALLHNLEAKLPPVLSSDSGRPLWTGGFAGSVSHKNAWVLACVDSNFRSIGIDLEEVSNFPLEVSKTICVPDDFKCENVFATQNEFLAFVFSCKETLFKAYYPLCKEWFGFQEASLLSVDFDTGTFRIQKSSDIFDGYFKYVEWGGRRFIVTAMCL